MACEPKRQFAGRAADADDKLCASVTEGYDVDGEAAAIEQGGKPLGTGTLVARRVDGIEADELLRQFDRRLHGFSEIGIAHFLTRRKFRRSAARHDAPLREYIAIVRNSECLMHVLLDQKHG